MPGLDPRSLAVLALAAVVLGSCVSTGERSIAFVAPDLAESYIPLYMGTPIGSSRFAAAIVIAPNIAVTNDHNLNLIAPDTLIARSPAYDLLFFRTERTHAAAITSPKVGQAVIAYGQNGRNRRRERAVDEALYRRRCAKAGGEVEQLCADTKQPFLDVLI